MADTQDMPPPSNMDEKAPMDTPTMAEDNLEAANGHASQDPEPTPAIVQKPFVYPASTSQPSPPAPLTPSQQITYKTLLTTVQAWTTVPTTSARNAPTSPITDTDRLWLTRECILRYLRASKWSASDAATRLRSTLTWRREYGLQNFTPDYISIENETGKQVILGYDVHQRPCLMMNPARQNTKKTERQIHHLVFMLERTIDLMGPGQESLSLMINFAESATGTGTNLGQGKQTMSILQNHYPERLGRALVINVPWWFWPFFKVITPFIDVQTREKLKFNEDLRQYVPPEQLLKMYGGDVDFEYDHQIYWTALNKLAEERRKAIEERWIRGGKMIGESEMYLKGGEEKGVAEMEMKAEAEAEAKMQKGGNGAVDGLADKVGAMKMEGTGEMQANGHA